MYFNTGHSRIWFSIRIKRINGFGFKFRFRHYKLFIMIVNSKNVLDVIYGFVSLWRLWIKVYNSWNRSGSYPRRLNSPLEQFLSVFSSCFQFERIWFWFDLRSDIWIRRGYKGWRRVDLIGWGKFWFKYFKQISDSQMAVF